MSIRGFRKMLKPVIWVVTSLMVLSGAFVAYTTFKDMSSQRLYGFKINSDKISIESIERTKATIAHQYSEVLGNRIVIDRNDIEKIAIDELITRKICLDMAKEAKLKVSASEVDKAYKFQENAIASKHGIFSRWLTSMGYSKTTYRNYLKENLTIQKLQESYVTNATAQDVGVNNLVKDIAKNKKATNITDTHEMYANSMPKVAIEKDGIEISEADIARRTVQYLFMAGGDNNLAKQMAAESYDTSFKYVVEAKKRNVVVDELLPGDNKIAAYADGLFNLMKAEIKPTDKEIEDYFKSNQDRYKTEDKVPEFAEVKDTVKSNYIDEKAIEKMQELVK